MKRLKIVKSYLVLWLFIYFIIQSNIDDIIVFFEASLTFNIAVLTLTVIGIIVILRSTVTLVMLAGTFGALAYKKNNLEFYLQGIEKIMPANIAHMFYSRAEKGVLLFTAEESRAVIEWVDEKFSHQNRYINYFTGTVLMIGLLGTFSGLLVAIDQMGRIILSLTGDINLGEVIRSFSGPLGGMAVGFGSSLFGVVAAIIMGVMGYILNKNQEVFIEGVEDWLKGRIIDTPAGGSVAPATVAVAGGAEQQLPEHKNSFMDVFIDSISALTKEMNNIVNANDRLHSITVASVQSARDEHEQNYEMFENINNNLTKLFETTQQSSESIETMAQQLTNEQTTFENIEKLQKISITDIRKLTETLKETQKSLSEDIQSVGSTIAQLKQSTDEQTQQLLEQLQLQIQEHLQTRSHTKEDMQALKESIQQMQITLTEIIKHDEQHNTALIQTLQEQVAKLLLNELTTTSKEHTATIIDKLEEILQTQQHNYEQSQAEIVKHTQFLQSVVENSHESLENLRQIALKEGLTPAVQNASGKSGGFFSKLFK